MPSDQTQTTPPHEAHTAAGGEADSNQGPIPIAQLAGLSAFPHCALGQLIDIRGYVGVVVGIVNNSIKVRSPEGQTQSFNFHRLRTLYAPVVHPEPVPSTHHAQSPQRQAEPAKPLAVAPRPKRDVIEQPDFSAPVIPIVEFVRLPDFPKCALGRHVDVAGFKGVVVEIVKQSLKVRAADGLSRSYNAPLLQQLHKQT